MSVLPKQINDLAEKCKHSVRIFLHSSVSRAAKVLTNAKKNKKFLFLAQLSYAQDFQTTFRAPVELLQELPRRMG